MKKVLCFIFLIVLGFPVMGYSQSGTTYIGGGAVYTASNCDTAAYYDIGTLCQDTDDGKLYKGTGAAVEEIPSTSTALPSLPVGSDTYWVRSLAGAAAGWGSLDTDGTLSSNSDARIASQKATKTYVDTGLAGKGEDIGFVASVNTGTDTLTISAGSSRRGNTVTSFAGGTAVGPTGTGTVYVFIGTDGAVNIGSADWESGVTAVGVLTTLVEFTSQDSIPANGIPVAECTVTSDNWVSCTDTRRVFSDMPIVAGAGISVSVGAGATIRTLRGGFSSEATTVSVSAIYSDHLITLNNADPVAVTIPAQGGGYGFDFLNLGAGAATISIENATHFFPGDTATIVIQQFEAVGVVDDGADSYHIVQYVDKAGTGLTKTCTGIACTWAVDGYQVSDADLTAIAALACTEGQVAIRNGAGTWICSTALGTAAYAATGDFAAPNASTTGSAGSLKSPTTTGLTTVTGPAAGQTRAKTVRDADDTILEVGTTVAAPTGEYMFTSLGSKGAAIVSSFAGTLSTTGSSTTVVCSSAADCVLMGYRATNPILGATIIASGETRYIQSFSDSTTFVVNAAIELSAVTPTSVQFPLAFWTTSAGVLKAYLTAAGGFVPVDGLSFGSIDLGGVILGDSSPDAAGEAGYDGALKYYNTASRTVVSLDETQTLTNKTLTAPLATLPRVAGHAAISPLSAAQVSGTVIRNTGQSLADVNHTLPQAAEGYNFIGFVGTTLAATNYWRFTADASPQDYMCLDGTCGKTYVSVDTPTMGDTITCYTEQISGTGIKNEADLAIGTSAATAVKNTAAVEFDIAGTGYSKAIAETAPGNDTIPQNKYGAVAFEIGADGTIGAIEASANATGYESAALAIAGIPAVEAAHTRLGTVTAMSTEAGGFVFGTTELGAANTTVAYTDAAVYTPSFGWICITGKGTWSTD